MGSGVRACAKALVEACLYHSGALALLRRRGSQPLVLAYHNVVPDGATIAGDASLHIPQSLFANHLTELRTTHEIVPLMRLMDGEGDRPRAAITFDDGYRGTVTAGREVLEELGVPATVFVVPGHPSNEPFWWDRLAAADALTGGTRDLALSRHGGRHGSVMSWARATGIPEVDLPAHAAPATAAELDAALAFEGLTVGSHTWSHPNLMAIGAEEVEEEVDRSLQWLRQRLAERFAPALSYPYGCWSPQVADAVAAAGYRYAFRVEGGAVRSPVEAHRVPRLNVPAGLSRRGFALRVGGLPARR